MKTLLTLAVIFAVAILPAPARAGEAGEVEINTPTLPATADVLTQVNTPGVREVEIRGLNLTPQQVNAAFLSTNSAANVLVQIGSQLRPGQEVDFRTVDGQRFRVQNEDGQLRVRVRDTVVQNRAALANFFSTNEVARFGRVEVRGFDAAGNRVRLEARNGVVKKDEIRAARSGRGREGTSASINNERATDRGRDLDHGIRGRDRAELEHARRDNRIEKADRPERVERAQRPERIERPQRIERVERSGSNSGRH
ncbi:MAG TPA: hypothetical protein VGV13_07840 [Methylomirabilota bacterium]|jgi:hypothetical protein|nr:hypothetical protein [Methylomirabilota bacterium]